MNTLQKLTLHLGFMFGLLITACNPSAVPDSPEVPTLIANTGSPATATEMPTTSPSATTAVELTATIQPTAPVETTTAGSIQFDFFYIGKILPLGENSTFDDFAMWAPDVIFHEGRYHMFYTAFSNAKYNNSTIGYAFSENGVTWTKFEGNPIISGTEEFQKLQAPAVMLDGDQWVMYLDAGPNGNPLNEFVLRATAPQPDGPWLLESKPVIDGRGLTWDQRSQPVTLLHVGETYYMYYSGVGGPGPQMGLATSLDNNTWTLYDDTTTTETAYAYSDPILPIGIPGSWDEGGVASYEVMYDDGLWEMFYIGFPVNPFGQGAIPYSNPLQIGYATSEDGLHWEKYEGNPVFSSGETCWPLIDSLKIDGVYSIYYDLDCGPGGLVLMQGTIMPRK